MWRWYINGVTIYIDPTVLFADCDERNEYTLLGIITVRLLKY